MRKLAAMMVMGALLAPPAEAEAQERAARDRGVPDRASLLEAVGTALPTAALRGEAFASQGPAAAPGAAAEPARPPPVITAPTPPLAPLVPLSAVPPAAELVPSPSPGVRDDIPGFSAGAPGFPAELGTAPPDAGPPRNLLRERLAENMVIQTQAELPPASADAPSLAPEPALTLVQLTRRLGDEERAFLAGEGIAFNAFVGGSTYVIQADAAQVAQSGLSPLMTAGRVMEPGDKLRLAAQDLLQTREPRLYHLTLAVGADPEKVGARLREDGAAEVRAAPAGLTAILTPDQLWRAAARPEVLAIDAGPVAFLPLNSAMRLASEAEPAQGLEAAHAPPSFNGVSGRGARITIYDTPIDEAHQDFCAIDGDSSTDRFFHRDTADPLCGQPVRGRARGQLHGTHVAAIAAGSGRNSARADPTGATPPFALRGVAPAASLSERGLWPEGRTDLGAFYAALAEDGADVSNHSFVETLGGYGPVSALIDAAIAGRAALPDGAPVPARPQVWAAGNNGAAAAHGTRSGYRSVLTQAKNSISVGSLDTDSGLVSAYSSLGPTEDGRLKPDLVAPGCHDSWISRNEGGIRSARAGFQGYARDCGTSSAAPVVTGAIALMCEAAGPDCHALLPSTFKAVLLASARDMAAPAGPRVRHGYGAGPDFASGFGRVDVAGAVRMIADPARRHEAALSRDGEVLSLCFEVSAAAAPLRIALVWDDPPAAPTDYALARLVNDLDLVLVDPRGNPHLPWTLPPLAERPAEGSDLPAATQGRDYLNNVELAEADSTPGRWRAEIRAATMGDGPQGLSLAGNVTFGCADP